jgi:hypothetical protein
MSHEPRETKRELATPDLSKANAMEGGDKHIL